MQHIDDRRVHFSCIVAGKYSTKSSGIYYIVCAYIVLQFLIMLLFLYYYAPAMHWCWCIINNIYFYTYNILIRIQQRAIVEYAVVYLHVYIIYTTGLPTTRVETSCAAGLRPCFSSADVFLQICAVALLIIIITLPIRACVQNWFAFQTYPRYVVYCDIYYIHLYSNVGVLEYRFYAEYTKNTNKKKKNQTSCQPII